MARPDWLDNVSTLSRVDVPTQLGNGSTLPGAPASAPGVDAAMTNEMVNRGTGEQGVPQGMLDDINAALQESFLSATDEVSSDTPPGADGSTQPPAAAPTTDADPVAGTAVGDGADDGHSVTAEADGTFTVGIAQPDGTTFQVSLTEDQARTLVLQNQWLQNQSQETLAAWAAIESGTHAPISREELAQFQAWKATGSPTAATEQLNRKPDLSYLDDDAAAYVARLEAQAQQSASTAPVPPGPAVDAPSTTAVNPYVQAQQIAANQQVLDSLNQRVATTYGFTDAQLETLMAEVANSNQVANIINQHTQYSPTGAVISRPSSADAVARAYDVTIATSPTFQQQHADYIYNQRAAREASLNSVVNGKKALAGSLASTAPAAVPSVAKAPQDMNPQELRDGIAGALRELQSTGAYSS